MDDTSREIQVHQGDYEEITDLNKYSYCTFLNFQDINYERTKPKRNGQKADKHDFIPEQRCHKSTVQMHHHGAKTPNRHKNHVKLERPVESVLGILQEPEDYKGHVQHESHCWNYGRGINYHSVSFFAFIALKFILLYRHRMYFFKLFLLGATGYLLAGLYDLSILYKLRFLSKVFYLGFFITAFPYPFLFSQFDSPLPQFLVWTIIFFLSICTCLLIYSVLLEFLLASPKPGELYSGGTYDICRHPGFLWYTTINILVALYFCHPSIALLMGALTLCNLILIIVEDSYFFDRLFPGYTDYKTKTPFLFPRLIQTFRRR